MRQWTVSFHALVAIVGVDLAIPSIIFVIHHEVTVGSHYYGWECVPMLYCVLSMFAIPGGLIVWGMDSGFFEHLWEWNPTFKFGKNPTIARTIVEKDNL